MKSKRFTVTGIMVMIFLAVISCAYAMGPSPQGGSRDGIGGQFLTGLVIVLLVLIVVLLILRELVCWYWKINETISLLKQIRDLLQKSISISKIESKESTETK
jgi:hypothetical protein